MDFTNVDYNKWLRANGYASHSAAPAGSYEKAKAEWEAEQKAGQAVEARAKLLAKQAVKDKYKLTDEQLNEYLTGKLSLVQGQWSLNGKDITQEVYSKIVQMRNDYKEGLKFQKNRLSVDNKIKDTSSNTVDAKPDAANDKMLQGPEKTSEVETLHDKLVKVKLSKADLKRIYELWKAGKWPYGIGPNTMENFKELGLVDPKPTNGPKNIDRTGELKNIGNKPGVNQGTSKPAKGFSQWLASEARLYWDLKGQIRTGKNMDDATAKKETMRIMRKMYNMGTGASITSLRSLQATEGLSDISGDMRSDGSVARSIARAWRKNTNGVYSPELYDN